MSLLDITSNLVLAMLPPAALETVAHRLERIGVEAGEVLYEARGRVEHVYFPLDVVVSLDQIVAEHTAQTGSTPSVALIGREGVVGIESFLGGKTWVSRATVRIGGQALRIEASALAEAFAAFGDFHRALLGSTDALFTQVAAGAACERVHTVQQRLIRWLLCFDDRVSPMDIDVTQEVFARLLGVRRVSVLEAVGLLKDAGLIASRRGEVKIADRTGLVALSCSCYRLIRERYEGFLGAH